MTGGQAGLLIIISRSFPFGEMHDFLEDEIAYLAEQFNSIRIAPSSPEGSPQPVPANVTVDLDLAHRVSSRLRRVGGGLTSVSGLRLILGELASHGEPRRYPEALGRLAAASGVAGETARWAASLGPLPAATLGLVVWFGASTIGLGAAGIRTVSRAHAGDLFAASSPHRYLPLQRQQLSSCYRVMCVSDAGRNYLRHRFPDLAGRCETRRLGVTGAGAPAARSTDGVIRVLTCSFLIPRKRPLLLVETIRALAESERAVEWDHYGSGPLQREFDAAIATLPVAVRATAHGHVENSVVLQHYAIRPVDVFLSVSTSEGVPVSMMEAISAGVPVVSTDVGGVGEIVQPETGTLVSPDDDAKVIARAMADEVARYDDDRRSGIRRFWSAHYSAQRNYGEFAAELASLARGGGA